MKILFVTGAYPKGYEDILIHLSYGMPLSIQANTFQWGIINGLEENEVDYQIVSYPFLSCFPLHFKKVFSPQADFTISGIVRGSMERFINVSLVADRSVSYNLYRYAKKWIESNAGQDKLVILVYTPLAKFIKPLVELKKTHNNFEICSIVTDLPEDYIHHKQNFSKYQKYKFEREVKLVNSLYSHIDKFILLTKQMEERIPLSIGKNLILEGICTTIPEDTNIKLSKDNDKTLLYTGSLDNHTCVCDLVDAFMMTKNKDYRLIICGSGEGEGYINKMSKLDSRIIFRGFLFRNEVLEMQQQATALINPRKPTIALTKYSFPSKTIEYMVSGTPLIGYKLDGIPQEYYEHFYSMDDVSNEALSQTIESVLNKSQEELNMFAEKARQFILQNKSSKSQVHRLLQFLTR